MDKDKKNRIVKVLIHIAKCFVILILMTSVVVGVMWADHLASQRTCRGVKIEVQRTDTVRFVSASTVLSDIERLDMNPQGKKIDNCNTWKLQRALRSKDYLENASCRWLTSDSLLVSVKQLVPVLRIFRRKGGSYYVNAEGKTIEANAQMAFDVPVVTGADSVVDAALMRSLVKLSDYISARPGLEYYVTAIDITDPHNVIIVPNIRGHVINFGLLEEDSFDNKFAKIRKIYGEIIPISGWWAYDTISVKWKHQIVATRRVKKYKEEPVFDDDSDELPPDLESITLPSAVTN